MQSNRWKNIRRDICHPRCSLHEHGVQRLTRFDADAQYFVRFICCKLVLDYCSHCVNIAVSSKSTINSTRKLIEYLDPILELRECIFSKIVGKWAYQNWYRLICVITQLCRCCVVSSNNDNIFVLFIILDLIDKRLNHSVALYKLLNFYCMREIVASVICSLDVNKGKVVIGWLEEFTCFWSLTV